MDATATRVAGPFTNPDLGFVLDTASVALLDTVGSELSDTESDIALLVGEASTVVLVAGPYLNTDQGVVLAQDGNVVLDQSGDDVDYQGSVAALVGYAASVERVS